MANTLRIKRRLTGSVDAPAGLKNAELAYNEVGPGSGILYYGKGADGSGDATNVIAIAGDGAFLSLSGTQSVSGDKTFTGDIIVPTQTSTDDSTKAASTAFVKAQNYLTDNQTITFSGDATGSGATSVSLTLADAGTAGTYTKVTTDAKGRVTAGTTLDEADVPTLTSSKISDFDTQVRTSRLDQMAVPTADVSLNSQKITGLANPTSEQDAATKAYVDATSQGLDVKQSVRAATTADITLSGTQTVDGVSLVASDRVLVKDQSTGSENGIYTVVSGGAWVRSVDADASDKVTAGLFVFVEEGTANADSGFVLSTDNPITLDTTDLTFVHFSGAGQIIAGAGLTKTGNTLDVGTADVNRIVVNSDNIDLATVGTAGTYRSVTTDDYGRVTAGTNPTTLSGYGITDAQPLDATLTALAGVTVAADQLIYATGADEFTVSDLTAFGRSLIDDVDAAAGRTTLGLGTISTQNANNVEITGGTIDNVVLDGGTF